MNAPSYGSCPGWPEVEALLDGRYAGRDGQRVERHLAVCAACRADRDALRALRRVAQENAEEPVEPFAHHRLRTTLLQRAAGGVQRSARTWVPLRRGGIALAAAACMAVVAVLGARSLRGRSDVRRGTPAVALSQPGVPPSQPFRGITPPQPEVHALSRVDAVGPATWTRDVSATLEVIHLQSGAVRVTVPHQHEGHRFLVQMPDGEIEVRGTQFVVDVAQGHTRRVDVFEGLVALRVASDPPHALPGGTRWEAPPEPQLAAPAPAPATAPASAVPPRAVPVDPERSAPLAFAPFAAGVEAMSRGNFGAAADSFARFQRMQPDDERVDDAAWLRSVALVRAGRVQEGRAALDAYLSQRPDGAHQREARRLAARLDARADAGVAP